jgi:hypothetical protein
MKTDGVELGPLNVVFARRGHDYEHFFKYVDRLRQQKETGTLFLKGPGLAPPLLDRANWSIRPADAVAGLQLADVVASSFYQAANSASPTWDIAPAQCLAPVIPDRHGVAANVGVTVWPLPNQAGIPDDAKGIFRHYGYRM